ncbi:uncharacterized protein CC84DRAFT_1168288 [Paraphaeosphaeria sporulosa]|uniref:YDG domain-containing protein n=1 Tax=Paraphaeosphaeria sporulosa TaxID=1460663 RepID=A0A177C2M6_9PLEO|nr:uncharacterized protein CC84DRAFT_1168288 [Paraphaeosphaeria sporulosa]OAG01149.1 hypothetical protein CC84DRAFT_1168288 [Paraphaeosphaeria sporulosa]
MADRSKPASRLPAWLVDQQSLAAKASDEFWKIGQAKNRGDDPMTTIYNISDEALEKLGIFKKVEKLQVEVTESQGRPSAIGEQRQFVSVEPDKIRKNEFRDSRPLAKVQKRKASKSPARDSIEPRKASRTLNTGFVPAEMPIAESSKVGAARKPSTSLDRPAAEDRSAKVPKSEAETKYEPKDLPEWLKTINNVTMARELKRPDKERTQALRSLDAFKDCIRRCEDAAAAKKPEAQLEKLFEELRDHVHKAEIVLKGVDKLVVRKTNMLTIQNGLPRIFMGTIDLDYPWDLRADAWQLYLRWHRQDFKTDLLRGIVTRKEKDRASDRIDPEWAKDPLKKIPANYHGQGHLVLGQWWPTQLCAVRDGAHGTPQGGIWGAKGKGAYSIVLSGGGPGYKDRDEGDTIWYSGTDKKEADSSDPTENTQRLIESCDEFPDRPVRVLRSSQLSATNRYRPKYGLRYDGLYRLVEYELLDKSKQEHLFKLVRCENQNPIRCENNAARRPTKYEEEEFLKLKR